jgi:hypothetical protein
LRGQDLNTVSHFRTLSLRPVCQVVGVVAELTFEARLPLSLLIGVVAGL